MRYFYFPQSEKMIPHTLKNGQVAEKRCEIVEKRGKMIKFAP